MIGHYSYCGREIQAANLTPDWYSIAGIGFSNSGRQSFGLLAKEKIVSMVNFRLSIGH